MPPSEAVGAGEGALAPGETTPVPGAGSPPDPNADTTVVAANVLPRPARDPNQPLQIFISYRREDSSGQAGRLYDSLSDEFGHDNVFIDLDAIGPGEDFADVIDQALQRCDVVLVVIGPRWLSLEREGVRRLDDPNDYLRIEIEHSLARAPRVIPVLVQDAEMPSSRDLPEPIKNLARRNAFELSDSRWRLDVGRLIDALEGVEQTLGIAPGARAAARSGAKTVAFPAVSGPPTRHAAPPISADDRLSIDRERRRWRTTVADRLDRPVGARCRPHRGRGWRVRAGEGWSQPNANARGIGNAVGHHRADVVSVAADRRPDASPSPSPAPSPSPSPSPTAAPTPSPTAPPTPSPTAVPTVAPTPTPTLTPVPTTVLTPGPSVEPTVEPPPPLPAGIGLGAATLALNEDFSKPGAFPSGSIEQGTYGYKNGAFQIKVTQASSSVWSPHVLDKAAPGRGHAGNHHGSRSRLVRRALLRKRIGRLPLRRRRAGQRLDHRPVDRHDLRHPRQRRHPGRCAALRRQRRPGAPRLRRHRRRERPRPVDRRRRQARRSQRRAASRAVHVGRPARLQRSGITRHDHLRHGRHPNRRTVPGSARGAPQPRACRRGRATARRSRKTAPSARSRHSSARQPARSTRPSTTSTTPPR